ncbi:MAG: MIP/aquaporin family protein [Candidatus Binatia bacterium]
MKTAIREHWPEYLIEAACLAAFMFSACVFGALLEHPKSAIHAALPDPFARRVLMGFAMGATAIAIIYSPFGKRSGAHINPSVTLTFFRLGKIAPADAFFYVVAQFAGGVLGVLAARALLGELIAHPSVGYVATVPGVFGIAAAFTAEVTITFVLMTVVLLVSNTPRLAGATGLFCGALVALYITFEAPISGMSMNPARTLGSAAVAGNFTALWIYFVAPPLGMLAAAEVYLRRRGANAVDCAKLHHRNAARCIFCLYQLERARGAAEAA